jgi:hypothetical protein
MHFDAFPRSVKRGILEWILTARKPETRAFPPKGNRIAAVRHQRDP